MTGAGSLLEIGSRFGYPLVEMAHVLKPGAKVVSVDLPDAEGWNPPLDTLPHLRQNIQRLKAEGYDASLLIGDSHSEDMVKSVALLGPYDVVFIDGDHSYQGVKLDWQYYGSMGKTVIFHDIRKPQPPENMSLEVWKFWDELKAWNQVKVNRPIEEFLAPGSKMGIGKIGAPESA